jgi:hypothetical protein
MCEEKLKLSNVITTIHGFFIGFLSLKKYPKW